MVGRVQSWLALRVRGLTLHRGGPGACIARTQISGVEVEEGVQAALELGFDLFARALDQVHGDVLLHGPWPSLSRGVVDFGDLAFGEQPQSLDKSQIGHEPHHN